MHSKVKEFKVLMNITQNILFRIEFQKNQLVLCVKLLLEPCVRRHYSLPWYHWKKKMTKRVE